MCAMKRSARACSLCSTFTICFFATTSTLVAAMAVALPIRTGWPARHPSPKKSPGPSIATTASLPAFESTDSLTPPRWMYITLSPGSPWEKMTSDGAKFTIFFERPAESRNA